MLILLINELIQRDGALNKEYKGVGVRDIRYK